MNNCSCATECYNSKFLRFEELFDDRYMSTSYYGAGNAEKNITNLNQFDTAVVLGKDRESGCLDP